VTGSLEGVNIAESMPTGLTMPCPTTHLVAYAAQDDFELLTEREFDLGLYRHK
jgi:hypothetical protein